jgi:FG-GAP repeat
MDKITDATGAASDYFGYSVSISSSYAIVGAPYDDVGPNTAQGSASIYQWNGTAWVLMNKISDATGAAADLFGYSVSISGNYAIVGAYGDDVGGNVDQGSVSIYQWNGTAWVLMDKITDATGAAGDYFGVSVSISGSYAIVGAFADDVGSNLNQGSVNIYQRFISNWTLDQKITDASGEAADNFGDRVSISGNYVIVGAYNDDVGSNLNQGSASIYQRIGSTWELMQKITDAANTAGDLFGSSVSISGNYAIVGAKSDDVGSNTAQGSANIYQRVGMGWQKLQYITDPGGNDGDTMGESASIDGITKRFIIGVPGYGNTVGKVLFGKIN